MKSGLTRPGPALGALAAGPLALGFTAATQGEASLAVPLVAICLGLSLGWVTALLWIRQRYARPLAELATAGELLARDSVALADALSATAQGDLTATLETEAKPA